MNSPVSCGASFYVRSLFGRGVKAVILMLAAALLAGCDDLMRQLPVQQLGARERGVVFRRLPTFLGGGVSSAVHAPGTLVIVWPWDAIYRVDTGSRDVPLGETELDETESGAPHPGGFVFTRANDGNEVALKMTVRYRVRDSEESLVRLIQEVASSNEELERIVVAVSRAAVRQHMNELKTSGFLREQERYLAVDAVQIGIQDGLNAIIPEGVEVLAVMLDRFEFARLLPGGGVDRSYQEKLNEALRLTEQTAQERLRIETVKEEGELREFEAQATVNRLMEEAQGIRKQAVARGDSYLTRRENEAKGILALGQAEVQGIVEKLDALSGPGGAAILRMEVAKALKDSDSRFVLMGRDAGDGSSLEVQRVDTNALLQSLGLFEGIQARGQSSVPEQGGSVRPKGATLNSDGAKLNPSSPTGEESPRDHAAKEREVPRSSSAP